MPNDELEAKLLRPEIISKIISKKMNNNIRNSLRCMARRDNIFDIVDKNYKVNMSSNDDVEVICLGYGNVKERIDMLINNILKQYKMYN